MNGPGRANAAAGNFIDDSCTVTTSADKVGAIVGTAMNRSDMVMNGSGTVMNIACTAMNSSGKAMISSGKFITRSSDFMKSPGGGI